MKTPPETLWLQWHGSGDPDDSETVSEGDVTHSREQIYSNDVEYVRADAVREALQGHRCSMLFGDAGLIAATMRALQSNA